MYKYINIWISYDKVADKMNRLAAQGYEYDKEYLVAVRMKKTSETNDKQYKFIYDKNFTPETEEYYKASGWKLHKFKFIIFLGLLKEIQIRIQYLQILKRNLKLLDIDC